MRNLFITIAKKLAEIEQDKGPFVIKCLIARDPDVPLWTLVLSAEWFRPDQQEALNYLTDRIMTAMDYDCMIIFSGILTYAPDSSNPLAKSLRQIQDNHRQRMYEYLRINGDVVIPTPLEQARLVVPFNDVIDPQTQAVMPDASQQQTIG